MPGPGTSQQSRAAEAVTQFSSKPMVYVLAFSGLLFYFAALKFSPHESPWIQVLFSLPVLAQFIGGLFHIRKSERQEGQEDFRGAHFFYYFSMVLSTFCIAAYCLLWVWYSNDLGADNLFSGMALLIISFLIICIGYMMSAFLKEPDAARRPKMFALREGARKEPLWALSFLFFVIFLDVTYLFGFAFAFHNRQCLKDTRHQAPALRMANYDSPDDSDLLALTATAQADGGNTSKVEAADASADPGSAKVTPNGNNDTCFYFFFDSGQARMETTDEVDYGACGLPTPASVSKQGQPGPTPNPTPVEPPQRAQWLIMEWYSRDQKSREQFNQRFNRCSLERIKKRIEQESKAGIQARVVLVGRSDNQPIAERGQRPNDELLHYKSNYELSEARVQNVRYKITDELKSTQDSGAWHNLEWLTLPSSDESMEDAILDRIVSQQRKQGDDLVELTNMNKRVVIASIVPVRGDITSLQMKEHKRRQFKDLNLMDYMYFSIYTITTTGYGDIIPTTAYSKFIVSIANICEVLFLVVFFNALVSIRGGKKKKHEQDGGESGDDILGLTKH